MPPVSSPIDLSHARARVQPGIFGPPPAHALSLELRLAPGALADDGALRARLQSLPLAGPGSSPVVGLGTTLLDALGLKPAGMHDLAPIGGGNGGFVATQADLWLLVPSDSAGAAFERATGLLALLEPAFLPSEATALFRYRDGRDLTGFRDGTENPTGDAAVAAAVLCEGALAGGSFAMVQRFVHRHGPFSRLPVAQQSLVIGRERESDEELDAAPASAHVKRTAQEDFDPAAFLWRRSMPWGTPLRHGLQFIAFMAELDRADRMLRKMAGQHDGITDALLTYTQAETGAYYFCPPCDGGRLALARS